MPFRYEWRAAVDSGAVEALHAEAFGHDPEDHDWGAQLRDHSLGWVCAFDGDDLVGFVNVAWDGAGHAFLIDTAVAGRARHRGVGTELVSIATERAAAAGCEWLHVDFDDDLRAFYFDACGFTPTNAGLIRLR